MGLIIPKNNADLETLDATLEIYNDAEEKGQKWVDNSTLIEKLSNSLALLEKEDEKKEPQSYTKKTQVLAYFGFITWEDLSKSTSRRSITDLGKRFYQARKCNDKNKLASVIIESLGCQTFGRNVIGCDSDSDIEAPNVFIKASLLFHGLTNTEFAYLLDKMELEKKDFSQALFEMNLLKYKEGEIKKDHLNVDAQKWTDPKPITALKNWGFLEKTETGSFIIAQFVIDKYLNELTTLRTKNDELVRFRPEEENINFTQQIFYGTPGTGKSYEVKKITGEIDDAGNEYSLPNVFRTTFHPDTDYASFVGCYKPIEKESVKYGLNGDKTIPFSDAKGNPIKEDYISYAFEPQVFTEAYVYAYNHPEENTYLVIEEINRGNCAQIFGDLFQLLDRKNDGTSEYKIKADSSLAKFLKEATDEDGNPILENKDGIAEGKLCLPANLSILATMNTSDQSLFPMDSAFKRRWDWEYVPIMYDEEKSSEFMIEIGSHRYRWVSFLQVINPRIQKITSSEDKMMGNFFIKNNIDAEKFKSKVMFYLWNEVLKDEVENNKYFLYGKNGDEKQKFMFSDLYGNNTNDTLVAFMKTLNVDDEKVKDYGNGAQESDPWYKSLWTEVRQKLHENGYNKFTAAPDSQYYQKGIGITGMSVIASVSKKFGTCWVGAYIDAKQAEDLYPKVKAKQTDLETKLGNLKWIENNGVHRRISLDTKFDNLDDERNRSEAIDWMVENLQKFYDNFKNVADDIRNQ